MNCFGILVDCSCQFLSVVFFSFFYSKDTGYVRNVKVHLDIYENWSIFFILSFIYIFFFSVEKIFWIFSYFFILFIHINGMVFYCRIYFDFVLRYFNFINRIWINQLLCPSFRFGGTISTWEKVLFVLNTLYTGISTFLFLI